MRVQNAGRILIAKGVELERDVRPGETTTVKAGFEKTERVMAMVQTGSLVVVVDGLKTEGGAVVAVHPETGENFDAWGKNLPLPKYATTLQQAQERQMKEEEMIAAQSLKVGEQLPIANADIVPVIIPPSLTEEQKVDVVIGPPSEPKREAIDELQIFLSKKGNARCRFVEEMTDLRALRLAFAAHARSGATRDALKAKIEKLSNVPEIFNL